MAWQSVPSAPGTYRIKMYNSGSDRYWKYVDNGDAIQLAGVDERAVEFKWYILNIRRDEFEMHPAVNSSGVGLVAGKDYKGDSFLGKGLIQGRQGASATWKISSYGDYSKVRVKGGVDVLDCPNPNQNACVRFNDLQSSSVTQGWVFQLVPNVNPSDPGGNTNPSGPGGNTNPSGPGGNTNPSGPGGNTNPSGPGGNTNPSGPGGNTGPAPPPVPGGKTFEQLWFQLTPEEAAKPENQYDIIIVGTGMGAGVIAGDLFDTNSRMGSGAKNVLVIEKGGLTFHSHCLNTSRPVGFGEDRGQQNDTFFGLFKTDYQFKNANQAKEWKAGPMFNLGGRGAAWGLFIPRIHDTTLTEELGRGLFEELVRSEKCWYKEAEDLMSLYLPKTNAIHLDLMQRLNARTSDTKCQWQWGRISSEFEDPQNFDFASGAYSPIDKLLEIAMSKGRTPAGKCIEHPKWKILINTEVRSIIWSGDRAAGVVVRDSRGTETNIYLKKDGQGNPAIDTQVILGAGSVGSPAILMRSGLTDELKNNRGLHLTDHDIFAKAFTFQYQDPTMREKVGSMKLQTYVYLPSGKISLVNVAVDSSSFLPRPLDRAHAFTNQDFPKIIVAHILPTPLDNNNTITLDANNEPVVDAERRPKFSNSTRDMKDLREVTKEIVRVIKDRLFITLRPTDPDEQNNWDDNNFFKPLELGGVAHELGTIPMESLKSGRNAGFLLDNDLKLRIREGVYVCDLSIFPWSPEVNPTLTLVALALRLSRLLHPRTPFLASTALDPDTVWVMNQTGDPIKIFVSNSAGVTLTQQEINENRQGKILNPGERVDRKRNRNINETVMAYQLDYNSKVSFQPRPTLYLGVPGNVCIVDHF